MPEPSVAYVIYGDFSFTEYIVVFNGYYSTSARDGYVMAALDSSAVNSWKIIPRHNPASDYPSDFSLVKVNSVLKKNMNSSVSSRQGHVHVPIVFKFCLPWANHV